LVDVAACGALVLLLKLFCCFEIWPRQITIIPADSGAGVDVRAARRKSITHSPGIFIKAHAPTHIAKSCINDAAVRISSRQFKNIRTKNLVWVEMNFEPGPKRRRLSVFDEITLLAVSRAAHKQKIIGAERQDASATKFVSGRETRNNFARRT